jgi:hypothetical protein
VSIQAFIGLGAVPVRETSVQIDETDEAQRVLQECQHYVTRGVNAMTVGAHAAVTIPESGRMNPNPSACPMNVPRREAARS